MISVGDLCDLILSTFFESRCYDEGSLLYKYIQAYVHMSSRKYSSSFGLLFKKHFSKYNGVNLLLLPHFWWIFDTDNVRTHRRFDFCPSISNFSALFSTDFVPFQFHLSSSHWATFPRQFTVSIYSPVFTLPLREILCDSYQPSVFFTI